MKQQNKMTDGKTSQQKELAKVRLALLNLQISGFDERQRGLLIAMEQILKVWEDN